MGSFSGIQQKQIELKLDLLPNRIPLKFSRNPAADKYFKSSVSALKTKMNKTMKQGVGLHIKNLSGSLVQSGCKCSMQFQKFKCKLSAE